MDMALDGARHVGGLELALGFTFISRIEPALKIRARYDIAFNCFQEVPILLMLSVHLPGSRSGYRSRDPVSPNVQARDFQDTFGNLCTRLVDPPGLIEIRNEFLIAVSGLLDESNVQAEQWPVGDLPMKLLHI
jgi:hypothetical protein